MYEFRTTTLCSSPVCFLYDIHLDVKDRGLWLCEWIPRPSGFAAPDERSAGFSPGRALARSSCMVSHDDSARGEAELGMAGFSLSGGGVGVGSRSVGETAANSLRNQNERPLAQAHFRFCTSGFRPEAVARVCGAGTCGAPIRLQILRKKNASPPGVAARIDTARRVALVDSSAMWLN
jgi:hypothetical protein